MVYLIVNEENKCCKIGYSANPMKRVSELKVGNHSNLILAALIKGDEDTEKQLHDKFSHLSRRGEWFLYNSEIIKYFNCWDGVEAFGYKIYPKFTSAVMSLTSASEFKALLGILKFSSENDPKLSYRFSDMPKLSSEIGITERGVQRAVSSLIDRKILLRPERGIYFTNPEMLYRGDNFNRISSISEFLRLDWV